MPIVPLAPFLDHFLLGLLIYPYIRKKNMLESIISPGTAERKPWDMTILGFVIASVAVWLGYYLAGYMLVPASMVVLAVAIIALAPLMHRVIVIEEWEEEACCHGSLTGFITRHIDVIGMYSFLFVGLLAAFSFWYVVLPYEADGMPSGSTVFGVQESAITGLQQHITGRALEAAKSGMPEDPATVSNRFTLLYENNMRIMLFCFLASFLFGAGAIWLIAWNASTIGVFIGSLIRTELFPVSPVYAYLIGFPYYSLSIALWAIPEILAYLVAGIAGGIVSVAVARHHFRSERFWLTVFDGMLFMIIAALLVFLGAYIEHFFVI